MATISSRLWRYLAGASVSLLGGGLLAVPLYDIWDDTTDLSWAPTTTVAENSLFLLLCLVLVAGGVWLVRTDWKTAHVAAAARRTVLATAAVAFLMGWAVGVQLFAMHHIKPYVIALDGVLIGAVVSFVLSVSTVRSDLFRREARQEREMNERLELLHRTATELEGATTRGTAYEIIGDAVGDLLPETAFRVVIDGETVAAGGDPVPAAASDAGPAETVPVGERGRIELRDGPLDRNEVALLELFAAYFEETIQRVDREAALRDERDVLEFINRTLRHDLLGDLSLVQARLRMIDRNVSLDDTNAGHLAVVLDRAEEMEQFVRTMRTYMQSVLGDDHELEAVALRPVVKERVDAARQASPEAEIVSEGVPDVDVAADDMLDRVFVNLLTNAVEHNDAPTPRVVVSGERHGDVARVRIADNGPGIPEDRRESIFERGEHGGEPSGSGFGLYLVTDVVEGYGGAVRVEENEPRGTVFELDLPLAEESDEVDEREESEESDEVDEREGSEESDEVDEREGSEESDEVDGTKESDGADR